MNLKNLPFRESALLLLPCLVSLTVFWLEPPNAWAQPPPRPKEIEVFDPPGGSAKPVTGGYARELSVPQGVESFHWGQDDFRLHFSVGMDEAGKVLRVDRIEYEEAEKEPWKEPFVKSCQQALLRWKFAPTYDLRKTAVASGLSMHIRFQRNLAGEYNIVVDRGVGSVFLVTNPGFVP